MSFRFLALLLFLLAIPLALVLLLLYAIKEFYWSGAIAFT
jgi:hypothetical protein